MSSIGCWIGLLGEVIPGRDWLIADEEAERWLRERRERRKKQRSP